MSELEWLITDKFSLNSGGKTPQRRKMESAAKCYSSRMCPGALNFATEKLESPKPCGGSAGVITIKSPLRSIENYLRQGESPLTSRRHIVNNKTQSNMFEDDVTCMEVFQNLDSPSFSRHEGRDVVDFSSNLFRGSPCSDSGAIDPSYNVHKRNMGEDLMPECSSLKMARLGGSQLDDKENFPVVGRNNSLYCEDVVRSPTRLDLSCLLSPSRRKAAQSLRRQHSRPTPSKFTIVRNTLSKGSSFPIPTSSSAETPTDKPLSDAPTFLDYVSRDSGFEHSVSYDDKINTASATCAQTNGNSVLGQELSAATLEMIKFHDELTQSACHFDMQKCHIDTTISLKSTKLSPSGDNARPHCSNQSQYGVMGNEDDQLTELQDYEYETLHDIDEFDSSDIPLGSSMSKYEIISTDSPDIATSHHTPPAVGRLLGDNFEFGSPIGEDETSENFGSSSSQPQPQVKRVQTQQSESEGAFYRRPPLAVRSETTRMLNFDTPSPFSDKTSIRNTYVSSLQDGSIFKLAIEQLSTCNTAKKLSSGPLTYDSGLGTEDGGDEDTLLMLDELESHEDARGHVQPASLHSLIHNTVIHEGKEDKDFHLMDLQSSPLSLPLRRPTFRRCISLNQATLNKKHYDNTLLFESPTSASSGGFKRPEFSWKCSDNNFSMGRKRRKQSMGDIGESEQCQRDVRLSPVHSRPVLQRAMSDNEATIKMALTRSLEDNDLIGDFSRAHRLPVVRSQHSDLKVITPSTLASLLEGQYSSTIRSYQIIDCRYPYEFDGGHIKGAHNLYNEESIHSTLISGRQVVSSDEREKDARRDILVFHCEFSLQRGPKLVRHLRCVDRALHRSSYPTLLHPELYLLGGGYCLFSRDHPDHTQPRGSYTTMLDPRHADQRRWHQGGKYKGKRV